jgi:hypothetical protein
VGIYSPTFGGEERSRSLTGGTPGEEGAELHQPIGGPPVSIITILIIIILILLAIYLFRRVF